MKLYRRCIAGLAMAAILALAAPLPAQAADPDSQSVAPLGTRENPVRITASGCGYSCDGKNPATYAVYIYGAVRTCSYDAETVRTNLDGINLELRYSPGCRTAWTRVGSDFYYPTIQSFYADGRFRTSYSGFAGPNYTVMVNDANLLARAKASAGPTTWWTSKY